ncbi:WXG100 family type VII secretion target [Mycobacterium avium]|uniref:WXG100 family type VII secretion target n=5 Tax=Mycobacterium avium TaxID=1764 RepID=UPI0015C4A15B|nr:WXG100 family type VII secretion target [Mycobacterium avium]
MVADSVRVDTEVVRAAGQQAQAAGATATPGSNQVQPSASDMVSVGASTRFTAQVSLARKYTAMANTQARQFGVKLNASAAVYDDQEAQSAATLGAGGGAQAAPGAGVRAGQMVPADLVSGGGGAGVPAGEVPASPRDVARLIETGRGGAGKKTWEAMESSLRSEAKQLDDAADQLGQAISSAGDGWQAESADSATARMRTLQTWYQGHARYVQGLAEQAQAHVQNFSKALTDVPPYRHVVDAERELKAAMQSNARSGGAYRSAVVQAQVKVSQLYQASTTGYSSYTFSEAAPEPKMPVPPPVQPSPDVPPAVPPAGPGNGPSHPPQPQHSPKGAPGEPVQGGPGVGDDLTGGPTWPPGAVDPADPAAPLSEALPETAGGMPSEVVPGLIGGVVGGLGGLLGGLAAAPQKALQGLEQAAGPMMSGLGQHPGGGEPQHGGEQSPPSSEPPAGDLPSPGDLGAGGGGGDTEPAGGGGDGPLAPPTDVAAAPAAAAPASAPAAASPAPAEAPAPAMGAMGPMMPPARGTGKGSGPDNKQLYQERKLKVVAPPNSEPVKNRREGRTRPDRKSQ